MTLVVNNQLETARIFVDLKKSRHVLAPVYIPRQKCYDDFNVHVNWFLTIIENILDSRRQRKSETEKRLNNLLRMIEIAEFKLYINVYLEQYIVYIL